MPYFTRKFCTSARISCFLLLLLLFAAASVSAQPHYKQTNLVSDVPGLAQFTDPDLVNPWGLDASATGPWWSANNETATSTLYNGSGVKQALVVTTQTGPTGIVFNGSNDFQLTAGAPATAARFILVSVTGMISGWNPSVNATNAVVKFSSNSGAVYLGATIAQAGGSNFLYVADFSHGTVDVFDANFAPVTLPAGAFTDPDLPEGFAPFNVQNIGGDVYVAFAKVDPKKGEEETGRGLGYVDVFNGSGTLLRRLEHVPWMNAPWGLAMAPATGFGNASGKLLVGMFGSGYIATFDTATGDFTGILRRRHGRPIEIEGLWALKFGNGGAAGPTTTLFFTAGIEDEEHGLFGTITSIPNGNQGED
jgi:uncharacterized protein (TIGR03118 family)